MIILKSVLAGVGAAVGGILLLVVTALVLLYGLIIVRWHIRAHVAGRSEAISGFVHLPHGGLVLAVTVLVFFLAGFLREFHRAKQVAPR